MRNRVEEIGSMAAELICTEATHAIASNQHSYGVDLRAQAARPPGSAKCTIGTIRKICNFDKNISWALLTTL